MGNIGRPKKIVVIPKPVRAPTYTTPTPEPVKEPELVPAPVRSAS